jgi:hypothetical protein
VPAQNRVTPLGEIVAIPLRGAWTGNRGILHEGRRIVRSHASDLWITCALQFRGRWREQWLPHRYTHLYFHDEAVSFAAGHRPCAECRRDAYRAYQRAWTNEVITARGAAGNAVTSHADLATARQMNAALHAERIVPGTHRRRLHEMSWPSLPDGTFVLEAGGPALVLGDAIVPWTHQGYGRRRPRPKTGTATVITPPSTVAVLRTGYPVQIDDAARNAG